MLIEELKLKNFRNYRELTLQPHPGVNLFYGRNESGKTNLLEAIGLFSGRERFHTKSAKRIAFGRDMAKLQLKFDDGEREQVAKIVLSQKNQFALNGVPIKRILEIYLMLLNHLLFLILELIVIVEHILILFFIHGKEEKKKNIIIVMVVDVQEHIL